MTSQVSNTTGNTTGNTGNTVVGIKPAITETEENITIEELGETGSCIYKVSNIFTDTQCNFITGYILKHSSSWKYRPLSIESNVECNFITLNEMVNSAIPESKEIDDIIFKAVNTALVKMRTIHKWFNGSQDDGYTLRKIFGGTKMHVDGVHSKRSGFKNFVRCLSLIIVLNDDYDGGIFSFPNQGLKLKVKKGEAIMFPPYWTHPHSVTSVGEGQARYTINTWILEKFID
jgi:2OG-Fe(II) oxygenase superfamily